MSQHRQGNCEHSAELKAANVVMAELKGKWIWGMKSKCSLYSIYYYLLLDLFPPPSSMSGSSKTYRIGSGSFCCLLRNYWATVEMSGALRRMGDPSRRWRRSTLAFRPFLLLRKQGCFWQLGRGRQTLLFINYFSAANSLLALKEFLEKIFLESDEEKYQLSSWRPLLGKISISIYIAIWTCWALSLNAFDSLFILPQIQGCCSCNQQERRGWLNKLIVIG